MNEKFRVITVCSTTGFAQVLTDPAYWNQIVVFTHPHIGLYDYRSELWQSGLITVAGVVAHYISPSWKDWLSRQNVPYAQSLKNLKPVGREFNLTGAECIKPQSLILWDFGNKAGIQRAFETRGVLVCTVSKDQNPLEVQDCLGYVLSSGPGDPRDYKSHLPTIRTMLELKPVMAICLGHQLLGMALGLKAEKMESGHHGSHFPVTDILRDKTAITAQNHSYNINTRLVKPPWQIRFVNLNDGSLEGLYEPEWGHVSTQFHPEGEPGPQDFFYLIDEYVHRICS
ncbi:MAG: hypothetical protein H3C47_01240 [Candidatus Cloacimonetes bacterium]|nr:hypothetical protein [Candidatus Cloacimonadota bacterium]